MCQDWVALLTAVQGIAALAAAWLGCVSKRGLAEERGLCLGASIPGLCEDDASGALLLYLGCDIGFCSSSSSNVTAVRLLWQAAVSRASVQRVCLGA